MTGVRRVSTLLALAILASAGCLARNSEYACQSHGDCASGLNHVCRSVAVTVPVDEGPCALPDHSPIRDHDRCYYAYCSVPRSVTCGSGTCPAGQTCVLAKEEDYSDTRLMCLTLDEEGLHDAGGCAAVDWINADQCDQPEEVCVLSFEQRAIEGDDDKAYICAPISALAPLQ